jgi:urease subunit alpha
MFGAMGGAVAHSAVTFVSQAAQADGIGAALGLNKTTLAVENTRNIGKSDMVMNSATPHIEVNPETYEVHADGVLLTCEPAKELPMAQRYFMF